MEPVVDLGADLTGATGDATGGADPVGTSEDVTKMVDSCRKVISWKLLLVAAQQVVIGLTTGTDWMFLPGLKNV